jgi:ABC-2 type transport system ATP-binding protein
MIKISNLSKSFTDKMVLNNLNLEIKDGEVFGLVGINGAGKSTLLRLMSGIYKADNGSILIDGEEVYENEKIKNQIFFLPDEPYYAPNTTPLSLIGLYETFYDFDKDVYLKYLKKFALPLKKSMHNFSKGMKRQVFISLAIAIKPKYLFLDEAFDGLDPLARLEFKRSLIELVSDNNMTVIISSHSLRELEDICDSYGLIDNMEISSSGNINDELEKVHKYQVAFEHIVDKDDFDIDFISYQQDKRIIKVVVNEEIEEFTKKIEKYKPLIIDEIQIDFEELFIIQVESRGYLNAKND